MRNFLFVTISTLVCTSSVVASSISFREFWETVQRVDPSLLRAEIEWKSSEARTSNSWALFLPQLDFQLRSGIVTDFSQNSSEVAVGTGFQLSETLWDSGKNWTQLQRFQAQEEKASIQLRKTKALLFQKSAEAFVDYSTSVRSMEIFASQLALLEKQFRFSQRLFQQGVRPKRDAIRFESQYLRAQLSLEQQKTRVKQAEIVLKTLLQMDLGPVAEAQFDVLPVNTLSAWESALEEATSGNVSFDEQLSYQERAEQESNVWEERLQYWPTVRLNGGVAYCPEWTSSCLGTNGTGTLTSSDSTRWNASVVLTLGWNLLDFGVRRRNLALARMAVARSEKNIAQAKWDISSTRATSLRQIEQLFKTRSILARQVSLEQEAFTQVDFDYSQGKTSFLDYQQATSSLNETKRFFIEAQGQLIKVRLQLWALSADSYLPEKILN